MPGKYKTEEIRKLIVEAKQKGETLDEIAERFHVGRRTVSQIWNLWKVTKSMRHRRISGNEKPRQDSSDFLGIVESMPRRMKAVIKAKGYPTKY
uniref:Resolvase HTH domain-containing protein n=1 Tax=Acrobeloides nanus TaxID=290746 RepID=A0A914ENS8_9BILA